MKQVVDKWLEVVAEKLGLGVEHFWPVLVKQQFIEGVVYTIGIILIWLFFIWYQSLQKKFEPEEKEDKLYSDDDNYQGYLIFGILIIVVSISLSIKYFLTGITHILNPEYHAIMDIGKTLNP